MTEFLVRWGPIVLLIGVFVYITKKGGVLNYSKYVQEMKDIAAAQLLEAKQTNAILTRIEAAMIEKRL